MRTAKRGFAAKALPYGIFVISFLYLGAVVSFIDNQVAEDWLGRPRLGSWIAFVVFVVGGYIFGLFQIRSVFANEELTDPFSIWCCWLIRWRTVAGYLINSVAFSSVGAMLAMKREGFRNLRTWNLVSSVIFAAVWVPVYTFLLG